MKNSQKAKPITKSICTRKLSEIDSRIRKQTVDTKAHPESCGYKYTYIQLKPKISEETKNQNHH